MRLYQDSLTAIVHECDFDKPGKFFAEIRDMYAYSQLLLPLIVQGVGGSPGNQSLCMSISAFAQVPFMIISKRTNKKPPHLVMIWSIVFGFIGSLCFFYATSIHAIYLGYALIGACIGVVLPARRRLVFDLVPGNTLTSAQSIGDAMYDCAAGTTGGLLIATVAQSNLSAAIGVVGCIFVLALLAHLFCGKHEIRKSSTRSAANS